MANPTPNQKSWHQRYTAPRPKRSGRLQSPAYRSQLSVDVILLVDIGPFESPRVRQIRIPPLRGLIGKPPKVRHQLISWDALVKRKRTVGHENAEKAHVRETAGDCHGRQPRAEGIIAAVNRACRLHESLQPAMPQLGQVRIAWLPEQLPAMVMLIEQHQSSWPGCAHHFSYDAHRIRENSQKAMAGRHVRIAVWESRCGGVGHATLGQSQSRLCHGVSCLLDHGGIAVDGQQRTAPTKSTRQQSAPEARSTAKIDDSHPEPNAREPVNETSKQR